MATYSNQHWLLSHIRNSFISTDDSGMCETVMLSDDLPKHFLRNYHSSTPTVYSGDVQEQKQQNRRSLGGGSSCGSNGKGQVRNFDTPLPEVNFICYPGLDESDEEDVDFTAQSFDIQMYPEVGAHRFRSNTAQKLEKMDIARRKAARTKSINFEDDVVSVREDYFQRKEVPAKPKTASSENGEKVIKSKLTLQMESSPMQAQNKFMEFARFDGTSMSSIQTKRFNVFMSMLPERERNYPIRICVTANAKILEVIGLVCYKATVQFPDLPLKSVRHYALYMTEDNDDLEDFPPLDNREPCSKFGFSYLTLAERRPQVLVTPNDNYHNNLPMGKSDDERIRPGVRSLTSIELNGVHNGEDNGSNRASNSEEILDDYEEQMLSHDDMLEAPLYRTYQLQIIDKRFFKTDVTLGLSGERIEIDQHKNIKFWTKQKAATYAIDLIACCEITERRTLKAMLRIWLRSSSSTGSTLSSSTSTTSAAMNQSIYSNSSGNNNNNNAFNTSTLPTISSPISLAHTSFSFITGPSGQGCVPTSNQHGTHMRFKSYDFCGDLATVEHVNKKLNYILEVRSSEVRREFMEMRERKAEKSYMKKNTIMKM